MRDGYKAAPRRKLDDEDLPPGLAWLDASEVRYPPQRELLRDAAILFGVTQGSIRTTLRPRATSKRIYDVIILYGKVAKCLKHPAPWFQSPNPGLGGKTPFEALATANGLETVANLLDHIESGTAA